MLQEMTKNDNLTSRQKRVLPFLVGEASIEDACQKANISRETIYRWFRESPVFVEAIKVQRETVLNDALDRLKGAGDKAVNALVGLLDSVHEGIRERAAGRILDYLLKVREAEVLKERVEALEKVIKEGTWGSR